MSRGDVDDAVALERRADDGRLAAIDRKLDAFIASQRELNDEFRAHLVKSETLGSAHAADFGRLAKVQEDQSDDIRALQDAQLEMRTMWRTVVTLGRGTLGTSALAAVAGIVALLVATGILPR